MYKTYQDAKIANPESEILTTAKEWRGADYVAGMFDVSHVYYVLDGATGWVKCSASDYCMTTSEFLKNGNKFNVGDVWLDADGSVNIIKSKEDASLVVASDESYVLRSMVLNGSVVEISDMYLSRAMTNH